MNKACYRKLRNYKYELLDDYHAETGILEQNIQSPYINLESNGILTIKKRYAWDGPSGPTIDTLNFMRGALIHDALYQLIRMEELSYNYKKTADKLLRSNIREDGMSRFRSWYIYKAVKLFGGSSAKPGTDKPEKKICVPE